MAMTSNTVMMHWENSPNSRYTATLGASRQQEAEFLCPACGLQRCK